jgi:predicted RNA methylase
MNICVSHSTLSLYFQLFRTSQDIAPFADPKIELEQYPTGPHLAARLLYTVRRDTRSCFKCTDALIFEAI